MGIDEAYEKYDMRKDADGKDTRVLVSGLEYWWRRLVEITEHANEKRDRELLFDVKIHPWKELDHCERDLKHLKMIWDHATLVHYIFESWQSTPFAKVDCDGCFAAAKKLQQQFVALDALEEVVHIVGRDDVGRALPLDARLLGEPRLVRAHLFRERGGGGGGGPGAWRTCRGCNGFFFAAPEFFDLPVTPVPVRQR